MLATGINNPHAYARRLCHHLRIPWEHADTWGTAMQNQLELAGALLDWHERQNETEQLGLYVVECDNAGISFGRCGSPIEELFLAYICGVDVEDHFTWLDPDGPEGACGEWRLSNVRIAQQVKVRDYRIDFTLTGGAGGDIAIELDGHDFHERTKRQAARDKSRDRALQEANWKVLRFTGSEVWKDPLACVRQAYRIARGGT